MKRYLLVGEISNRKIKEVLANEIIERKNSYLKYNAINCNDSITSGTCLREAITAKHIANSVFPAKSEGRWKGFCSTQ